jgi:hypothetical protein
VNPAYNLRCQFRNGEPGVVKQYICANRDRCHRIFRNRRQVRISTHFLGKNGEIQICDFLLGWAKFLTFLMVEYQSDAKLKNLIMLKLSK